VRLFYGPADWLAARTTVRQRRAINFWLLVLWLGPGTALWLLLRDALWFIGFMSLYALWSNHYVGVSAETPVEHE
jgi:hypothetical protein